MMANPRFMPTVVVAFFLLVVMAGLVGPAAAGESGSFWVSVPGETSRQGSPAQRRPGVGDPSESRSR